jgi:hypothetical protein
MRYSVPRDVEALHALLVEPLFSVSDFRITNEATHGDLSVRFFMPGRTIASRRYFFGLVRERLAFQVYATRWVNSRIVRIDNPTDVGVFQLHSVWVEGGQGDTVHIRAEPNLLIEIACEAVEVMDEGESPEFETRRYRLGRWIFEAENKLLARERKP